MTTTVIYADPADAYLHSSNADYATARAGSGIVAENIATMNIGQRVSGGIRSIYVAGLSFDTSVIPDGDDITSAQLTLYMSAKFFGGGASIPIQARSSDFGASLDAGDWPGGGFASLPLRATLASVSDVVGSAHNFASDPSFAGAINKTGWTRLLLCTEHLATGTAPTGFQYATFHASEATGTATDPKLVVVHETPAGGGGGPVDPGVNSITDPGFDSGIASFVELSNPASFTTSHSTADGGVLKMAVTTANNVSVVTSVAERFDAVPGETIGVGAKVKIPVGTARTARTRVRYYTSAGAQYTDPATGLPYADVKTGTANAQGYLDLTGTAVVPADVTKVGLEVFINGAQVGNEIYVDDVYLGTPPSANQPPTADPGGPISVVEGTEFEIIVVGTDPDGTVMVYDAPVQLTGTPITLVRDVTFVNLWRGTALKPASNPELLEFQFTVRDDKGAVSAPAVKQVNVTPLGGTLEGTSWKLRWITEPDRFGRRAQADVVITRTGAAPPPPVATIDVRYSLTSDRSGAKVLEGAATPGPYHIFADVPDASRVAFVLRNSDGVEVINRAEETPPYDLVGSSLTAPFPALPLDQPAGDYELTVTATTTAGTATQTVFFTIEASTTPPPPPPPGTTETASDFTGKSLAFGGTATAVDQLLTSAFQGKDVSRLSNPQHLSIPSGTDYLRQRYVNNGKGKPGEAVPPTDPVQFDLAVTPAARKFISYEVYFEPGFEWVQGGKLPGLIGGTAPTGGSTSSNGFSARLMWKREGGLSIYLYAAGDPNTWGTDVMFTGVTLVTGQWLRIRQEVVMNSAKGVADGIVRGWFNGVKRAEKTNIPFNADSTTSAFQIDGLYYSSFYGGNFQSNAPSKTTYARFRRFKVANTIDGVD